MIKVKPFRAFIYNSKKFRDFSRLVCPPYDVISPREQDGYYKQSNYNIIRLILGKTYRNDNTNNNRYSRAAKLLKNWIKDKILIKDRFSSIYFYEQRYWYQGKIKTRQGFISLLKIQADMVHPHEHTHLRPKEDRLQLLKKVEANLSPIFVLFSDTGNCIVRLSRICSKKKPLFTIRDSAGVHNRLWRIRADEREDGLSNYMRNRHIFIADGHHRFEVACAYRDMLKSSRPDFSDNSSCNYIMAYFTNIDAKDLLILPTHRLFRRLSQDVCGEILERLEKYFHIEGVKNKTVLLRRMSEGENFIGTFGVYFQKKFYIMRLKETYDPKDEWGCLDVSLFNKFILKATFELDLDNKNIIYSPNLGKAIDLVNGNEAKIAFFLNPTKINQLKRIVLKRQKMPPKSTYFYPKLLSGLVIHKFGETKDCDNEAFPNLSPEFDVTHCE